jgi:hypothetical protein
MRLIQALVIGVGGFIVIYVVACLILAWVYERDDLL